MSAFVVLSFAFFVLVLMLLPGFGAMQYQGDVQSYLRRVLRFSIAYFKCGAYSVYRLVLAILTWGRKPAVFQYLYTVDTYCTLLGACVMRKYVKDTPKQWDSLAGFQDVIPPEYVLVKLFYLDPARHPRNP